MSKSVLNRICALLLSLASLLPLSACDRVKALFVETQQEPFCINEVVTSNQLSLRDEVYGSPDWIELYNGTSAPIQLSNYYLTDNVAAPQKATRLPEVELQPGEYLVLFANKKDRPNCLDFSLKRNGETLSILNARMEEVTTLVIPALIRDVSYARRADGTYGFCDLPTPGADNGDNIQDAMPLSSQLVKEAEEEEAATEAPRSPAILITEVVSKNVSSLQADGCQGCTEWIELYNPNEEAVSLLGYALTDDMTNEKSKPLPERALLPGQYALICCGRGPCAAEGHMRIDLGLSAKGEELFLFDPNGNLLDTVAFPALPADVSWAKGTDGAWHFCVAPTPGTAPEEAAFVADLSPQPMEAPLRSLHISEALYRNTLSILDEDGDRSDFVELYNAGGEAVSLSGWYLSDNPDKLTKWPLPDLSLAPGEYLLVFLSGKDRKTGELHASFSLHAGETLCLYDSVHRRFDSLPIPETAENVSVGRDAAGVLVYYSHPTPLEENGTPLNTGK